jgi:hypothetical protein
MQITINELAKARKAAWDAAISADWRWHRAAACSEIARRDLAAMTPTS